MEETFVDVRRTFLSICLLGRIPEMCLNDWLMLAANGDLIMIVGWENFREGVTKFDLSVECCGSEARCQCLLLD